MNVHRFQNTYICINRTPDESVDTYHKRVGFIMKKIKQNPHESLESIILKSIIWRNIKLFGMSYPNNVKSYIE